MKRNVLAYDLTIEELDMSVRSFNCLKRAGIDTVGQLLDYPKDKLPQIRNIGKKSYEEVCNTIKGLHDFFHVEEQD